MAGAARILVKRVKDAQMPSLPTNRHTAVHSVTELRVARLQAGWRGRPAGDMEPAVAPVRAVGAFTEALCRRLVGLDVNALLVLPQGTWSHRR
jgi:acetate---CoA ligase (ADP-forming)